MRLFRHIIIGAVCVLCMFLLGSVAQTAGKMCPDQVLPEGYYSSGGWMVTDPYAKVPQYSLNIASRKDRGDTLFLSRLLYNDEKGCAHWKIVSTFDLPERHDSIVLAYECRKNGAEDRAVFAYVRSTDGPEYTTIVQAWRVMMEQEKIVAITSKGIVCVNQGYGL